MDSKINLKDILKKHEKWLKGDPDGVRADLSVADLSGANLIGADLSGANLIGANLSVANLSGANLIEADLSGANLSGANLIVANLSEANLSGADLSVANLSGANLIGADLYVANLSGANLIVANLSEANLSEANLIGADLSGADLSVADLSEANLIGADLYGADLIGARIEESVKSKIHKLVCPECGSFIGWKKAHDLCGHYIIVKLQILEDAKRSSAYGRKCRCDKAKVLELQILDGGHSNYPYAVSIRDHSFKYIPGEIVSVDNFDEDRWNECSTGIHFFITRQEAVDYVI